MNDLLAMTTGYIAGKEHRLPVRVYFEDTDAAGIVYHSNYLKYAERARTEMLRLWGIEHSRLVNEQGLAFAVRHLTVDYQRPGRLDDLLEVRSRIVHVGGASVTAEQDVVRVADETVLVGMTFRLVFISMTETKAERLSGELRNQLLTYLTEKRED